MVNYIHKEDPSPLSFGAIPKPDSDQARAQIAQKRKRGEDGSLKQSKASKYATDLLSGGSTRSILQQDPGYYLQNKRKIEEFASMCAVYNSIASKQAWPASLKYTGTHPETLEIIEWLSSNIRCERAFRQEQLYISGPKQHYKTTIIRLLKVFLMTYDVPKGEEFYDLYEDGLYDLLILDEFKGQKKLQDLNEWLQGDDMNIRQKGKQYYKRQNLPMIILANWPLPQVYHNLTPEKIEPTMSRLQHVHLNTPIDIRGFAEALGLQDHPITRKTIIPDARRSEESGRDHLLATSLDSLQSLTISDPSTPVQTGSRPSSSITDRNNFEKFREQRRREKQAVPDFCKSCAEVTTKCKCG